MGTSPAEKLAKAKPKGKPREYHRPWACRLQQFRKALGLSLRDVSNAIGMSNPALWAIEAGGDVMLTNARKLCRFYGKTVAELWPEFMEDA